MGLPAVATQLDEQKFFNAPITADNILVDEKDPIGFSIESRQQIPFYQHRNLGKIPRYFHIFTLLPPILVGLAVISGGLVMLLHDDKRRGVRGLARTALSLGVLVIAGVLLTNFTSSKLTSLSGPLANQLQGAMQQPTLEAVRLLANTLNDKLLIFGVVYTVAGAGALVALRLTKPNVAETAPAGSPKEPEEKAEPEPPKV